MTNLNLFIKRKENQMTQKELAEKIGMHYTTYYKKESARNDFTITEARMLTKVFDCGLDDLFGEVTK